ncbi:MAG TPA: dihydroneopterin aldolase [Bacteroidales bacterium]|nr:dihydroneopterin aldolase [Bacteroidales bacterium]
MGRIILEDMEFYAYHGCFAEEQVIGGRFLVTVKIDTETTIAEQTDDISGTINYQEVYALIKKEMAVKSKLLEHVTSRIACAVKEHFPAVHKISVKVTKTNPPVGGKMAGVSVSIKK